MKNVLKKVKSFSTSKSEVKLNATIKVLPDGSRKLLGVSYVKRPKQHQCSKEDDFMFLLRKNLKEVAA